MTTIRPGDGKDVDSVDPSSEDGANITTADTLMDLVR